MRIDRDALVRALSEPPHPLADAWLRGVEASPASVLVPVVPGDDARVVAVLRPTTMREHAGEVAFPGGKVDAGETLRDAALREAHEEVGLGSEHVDVLGVLTPTPVITRRYLIHPHVAVVHAGARPEVRSRGEVARLVEVPLGALLSGALSYDAVLAPWRGAEIPVPAFPLEGGVTMYGASAFILFDLMRRLSLALDVPLPDPILRKDAPWGERYARWEK